MKYCLTNQENLHCSWWYAVGLHNFCDNRHWTRKRLHSDSIWDSIQIWIVAADSIRTKISDSQVPIILADHAFICFFYSTVLFLQLLFLSLWSGICFAAAIQSILAISSTTRPCRCSQACGTARQQCLTIRNGRQNCLWPRTVSTSLTTSIMTAVWQKARCQHGSAQLMSYASTFSIQVHPGPFWVRWVEAVYCSAVQWLWFSTQVYPNPKSQVTRTLQANKWNLHTKQ